MKCLFVLSLLLAAGNGHAQQPPYKNSKLPVQARVKDLLQRMTLEEKLAQTFCIWENKKAVINPDLSINKEGFQKLFPHGLGSFARPSENLGWGTPTLKPYENAVLYNNIQRYCIEQTRLGIPVLCHEESLHGNQAPDATVFPTHLALGSTWNEDLIKRVYTAIAEEVYLRGSRQVLAPVVDVGRDPRWGRTEETLGEDPYHISRLAVAEIEAYQGSTNGTIAPGHVVATLKHFGVHGIPESGTNVGPTFFDERTLREVYLYPFEYVIKRTKPQAIMPCYAEMSGVPSHSSSWQLNQLLRKEWGFNGIVVSDYFAVRDLVTLHKITPDSTQAAALALKAGVDIELPDVQLYNRIKQLLQTKQLPMAVLDTAVSRILAVKFRAGLFENPFVDPQKAKEVVGGAANRKLALETAQQSMVLLKNSNHLLPIDPRRYKKIAVIGPNAAVCNLGGYTDQPKQKSTPWQALQNKIGTQTQLVYAEGCRLTDSGTWFKDPVIMSSTASNAQRLKEAVEMAKDADLILLFLGSNEAINREAWSADHPGDVTTLELMGNQNQLVQALHALGKPMAGFLFSGPPLAFTAVDSLLQSVVQCWFLGQETGDAVADLILGNINPSGKLSISIPRSVGHLPVYYSMKPSARRTYQQESTAPLYPFGYGLSYTQFSYSEPVLSRNRIGGKEETTVTVNVSNSGSRAGAEVVQLYIRDDYASLTRPVKELKGFQRIELQPGETKKLSFTIGREQLEFVNAAMKRVVEPGTFTIMVGGSSHQTKNTTLTVIK